MKAIKRFIRTVSKEMGHRGEVNDRVMAEAASRIPAAYTQPKPKEIRRMREVVFQCAATFLTDVSAREIADLFAERV